MNEPSTFNAQFTIWQGDEEFRNTWQFTTESSGSVKDGELITHITEVLDAAEQGEEVWEDNNEEPINTFGLSNNDFAMELVKDQKGTGERYGTQWSLFYGEQTDFTDFRVPREVIEARTNAS